MEPQRGPEAVSKIPARLTRRACVDCHARKVRCDVAVRGFPCSNCLAANVDCRVAERRKRRRTVAPGTATETHKTPPVQRRLGQSSSTCTHGPDPPSQEAGDEAAARPPAFEASISGRHLRDARDDGAVECYSEPRHHVSSAEHGDTIEDDDLSHSPPPAAEYAGEFELAKQHLVNFFSQNLEDNPIRTRLTYVGNELANLHYLTRQQASDHHVFHYPTSNTYIPRVFRDSRHTLVAPSLIPQDAFVLAPPHVADVLVADYFAIIHPTFPIINQDEFMHQYRAWSRTGAASTAASVPGVSAAGQGANTRSTSPQPSTSTPTGRTVSVLLLQAICLAGSHVNKTFRHNKQDLKASFFRRAKALLDGRYEEDRMEMVQAALLLTWFSDGGDDVCANAWWWIGVAARTAQGLGMHRDVRPSKMPEIDKRTWRRMWWCLVQFDCLVALSYGRPMNINLDDCDVPPLRADDFDHDTGTGGATEFVVQHAALCAIISEISRKHFSVKSIQAMNAEAAGGGGHSELRRFALETVDARLAEWQLGLPPSLRHWHSSLPASWPQNGDNSHNTAPWSMLLHITYNTALAQFHRTAIIVESSPETSQSSNMGGDEEICSEAASNVISIFDKLSRESLVHHCFFWAPSSLFTALLQVRSRLTASRNAILALRAREKYESGLNSLRRLAPYWLFSTSVWRLFESNSIRTNATDMATQAKPSTEASIPRAPVFQAHKTPQQVNGISPHILVSPEATISPLYSADASRTSQTGHEQTNLGHTQQHTGGSYTADNHAAQEMAWVQFLSNPDLMTSHGGSMHMERNRWNDSMDAWQSLYWSDPLAHIDLSHHDHSGQFHHNEWHS